MTYRFKLALRLLFAKHFLLVTADKNDDTSVMKTDMHINTAQAQDVVNFLQEKLDEESIQQDAISTTYKILHKR